MNQTTPSSLYYLPIELIDKITSIVAQRPDPGIRINNFIYRPRSTGIKADLLALSRIDKIGDNWFISAEKELCSMIEIEGLDSEALELLAGLDLGDRRFHYINEVKFYHEDLPDPELLFTGINYFSTILARTKKGPSILLLHVHYNIWRQMKPVLQHLHDLLELNLKVFPTGNNEDDGLEIREDLPITIADVSSLSTLKYLIIASIRDTGDLAQLFH